MTSPNLTNVVWVKTILYSYRHIWPKKVKYPIPEIPDDSENKSGMDWVLPKIIGSGRVSGTRQALQVVNSEPYGGGEVENLKADCDDLRRRRSLI